jgi:HD-GYP domain-containing protein (c-di-GMP phosphodiesterase class II)
LKAITSDRPYRKGLKPKEIIEELSNNSGTQLDPNIVEACLKVLLREGGTLIVNSGYAIAEKQYVTAKE